MKVLITGSAGFVGGRLVEKVTTLGWDIIKHQRKANRSLLNHDVVCEVDGDTCWKSVLQDVDCVVHCAARVHQMSSSSDDEQLAYETVNTVGTLNLARQAVEAGVKRFVFLSSIKVSGEYTEEGHPFTSQVMSEPDDLYGQSKYKAEMGLKQLADETGLEVVIIRPPLVYGPGVKANFLSMMRWVEKKIPLPFGAIHNRRSLVFVDNLVDLISTCCVHPNAVGKTLLVSDDQDVSVTQLLRILAKEMNVASVLIPVPPSLLNLGFTLLGKKRIAQRLCSSLQVDIVETKKVLHWVPPFSLEEGIRKTVQAYNKDNA